MSLSLRQDVHFLPYNGLPVPPEASLTREDSQDWYTTFFEKATCVPHRDGKHIIMRWPHLARGQAQDYRELVGWPVIKVRKVYERLGGGHPRIVRHAGDLEDGSLLLERLFPGPFNLAMPVMTIPIPETASTNDTTMLRLYYRWALQSLSALTAFHSKGIYLRTFSPQQIWLRSDFSLALTGFVGADITGDKTDYLEGGLVRDEIMEFEEDALRGCVNEDLFYWATFVWRCMTNDFTDEAPSRKSGCWEPCCPVEGCKMPYDENREEFDERYLKGLWQRLEEQSLGSVLVKAWDRNLGSANEAALEVKGILEKMEVEVDGDEVGIEGGWEGMFEVEEMGTTPVTRRLKFKT